MNLANDTRMTATTAILMIDVQKTYLEQDRRDVLGWPPIWRLDEVVAECRQLLAAGRAAGLPVIGRPGHQEPRWGGPVLHEGSVGDLHPGRAGWGVRVGAWVVASTPEPPCECRVRYCRCGGGPGQAVAGGGKPPAISAGGSFLCVRRG